MREVYARQKDQEEDDRRLKTEEQYLRKVEEAKRCENPKTKADFDMLYNKLEEWRRKEEDDIQVKDERSLNVSRAKLVMEEAKMLSKISTNKNLANLEAKENTVREFLYKASSPHCWVLSDGGTISIETPDTQRALELQNLYIRLKCDDVIPEERILVLNDLKENVLQFNYKLTKEMVDLIDREIDLMERGVKHSNLEGLRHRQRGELDFFRDINFSCIGRVITKSLIAINEKSISSVFLLQPSAIVIDNCYIDKSIDKSRCIRVQF